MNSKQTLALGLARALAASWVVTFAAAHAQNSTATADPADPSALVPPVVYDNVLSGAVDAVRSPDNEQRLPWRDLYRSDGAFVPEAELAPASGDVASPAPMLAQAASAPAPAAGGASDSRGVVQTVDLTGGKVKLKHGPIPKFDMSGMTMTFRVKDPTILQTIKQGDEVGFTVEREGSTLYVTGFQR